MRSLCASSQGGVTARVERRTNGNTSEKLRRCPDLHIDANAERDLESPMRIIRIVSCLWTLRHSLRPAPVIFDVTWIGSGSATAVVFVSTSLGSMSTVWEEPPTSVEYSLTSESATRGHASQHEASRLCISLCAHHTFGQIVQCCWLARVAALACTEDDGPCAAVLNSRTVRHTRRRCKQDNQPSPRHSVAESSVNPAIMFFRFSKLKGNELPIGHIKKRSNVTLPHTGPQHTRHTELCAYYASCSTARLCREREGRRRGGPLAGHTLDAAFPAT